jgi:glycosyltransferase involved in cell wall biosynthesis
MTRGYQRQRSVSIVLPAHNEEENIIPAVDGARATVESLTPAWELVVVDDGSSDETAHLVEEMAREESRIRLIRLTQNRGYGSALREGFAAARGDVIFYTDSDRQFDLTELRFFLPCVEMADVVVGFRVYRYDSVLRCLLSWGYNRLVNLLFRVRVRDVDCSFKLFRREVLETIDLETTDFFIDTEIVAKARKWNFRIIEKGVRHYPRQAGQTTVRASHIPRTLQTIGRMWWRLYVPQLRRPHPPLVPVCKPSPGLTTSRPVSRVSARRPDDRHAVLPATTGVESQ